MITFGKQIWRRESKDLFSLFEFSTFTEER